VAKAALVAVACLGGAKIGTAVRYHQIGTAVVFPPYAILTAALLLSPPREWWLYLLASSLGNFWPHREAGAPTSFVLLAELANYTRALVAAAGVRRFGDGAAHFDTFRGMVVFLLFAVVLGPLVAAFAGATVVALQQGAGQFWLAWQAWLLSNMLTGLTLLPIILIGICNVSACVRAASPGRVVEGTLLLLGLVTFGGYALLRGDNGAESLPERLYGPLPFLVWAAVRFGPEGTSASLLTIAVLAIGGATVGRGPFAAQSLLHLQLFLFALSVPLLLLAALTAERQQTAAALRESQERYRSIVEDQTEMILRFLPDAAVTFVNEAGCQAARRRPEQILGRSIWSLLPRDQRQTLRERLTSITPDHPVVAWERETVAPGGGRGWEHWRCRGFFDAHGRVIDYQAVGRDVTERKRAEEEHRLLLAEQRVGEALREADQRKDEFIAMLAHELRNPLAPIRSVVDILRRVPSADDRIQWIRDVLARQVTQLTRLVDDLIDISRITRGTIQLQLEIVDVERIIAQAVETSRPLIAAREHELAIDVADRGLRVRGDAVRLAQLVSNLLNNAAKYTDPRGRLGLTVERDGSEIVLTVTDTGVGIPPDMLARVFDLFAQVDSARDRALGGLGLGLTLVKRLAEMHGGTVEARSEGPGRGSEFVLRLPALPTIVGHASHAAGPASGAEAPGDGRRPAPPRRILVVDDNDDAAESLAHLLALDGHHVRVARDGLTALDAAERLDPDVVLLDIGIPGMDGLEIARHLRSRRGPDALLLVATTGFGQPADRRRTAEAGFDHHLVKPVDPQAVQALLARRTGIEVD
jgi:two-component system CheB/CheR fusion protein